MKEKKNQGSLTLEACIVVPIFLMVMLLANGLFIMFMGQQVMSHAMLQTAKSMAFDPYGAQKANTDGSPALMPLFMDLFTLGDSAYSSTDDWTDGGNVPKEAEERFYAFLGGKSKANSYAILDVVGVKGGAAGVKFTDSSYDKDTGILTVSMSYEQEFIFNAMGLLSFPRTLTVQIPVLQYK